MDVIKEDWYQSRLTALMGIIVSVALCYFSYGHYETAKYYRATPQHVLLDIYNRPIGDQFLSGDADHNPQYRVSGSLAESAQDFTKEALLTLFTYDKKMLTDGSVLEAFITWLSQEEGLRVYTEIFVNLSQQKIVMAQDGFVRARVLGDIYFEGSAIRPYESTSGLKLDSKTYLFSAKLLVTAYGKDEYPTVYNDVSVMVQRALLQDKYYGYQIISLEIK
jgi:hypothetical protein